MQYRCFFIPISGDAAETEQLNKFLMSVRVLSVDRQFSERDGGWSLLVSYHADPSGQKGDWPRKDKVDYSKLLSEDEYKRFVELKKIRREVYTKENVQAYMVFTDEELAEISRYPDFSEEMFDELKIKRKRLDKYGPIFISRLKESDKSRKSDGEDMLPPEP